MGIKNWIRSKFNGKKEEVLPECVSVDEEDLKRYDRFQRKKDEFGETKAYNDYIETDDEKFLSIQITDFNFKAVMVENLTYSRGSIIDTLKFDIRELSSKLRHPSIVLSEAIKEIKENDGKVSLYKYIKLIARHGLDIARVLCYRDKMLQFIHRPNRTDLAEEDNNNKEICFISSVNENVNQIDDKQIYLSPNIFRKKSTPFKGIIIQNLSLESNSNNELMDIDKSFERLWSENSDEFTKMAFELYKKTNGRILFVSQMDDIVVVKGTDESEPIIYSTLDEMNLPDELKKLPRYGVIRTATINSPENNKEFYNEHSK